MSFEQLPPKVKEPEKKKPKSSLAKKAGLVLGLGTAIGLSAATLEGLKNDPQNNIETSAETKKKDPGETVEQMSKDLQDLEGLDRKIKDQAKIDELRRFIARESKSGDELYSVGKDPFAVPGEPEDLAPQRELSETEIYKKEMAMNEEDLDHLSDFFDRVLKQSNNKYRFNYFKNDGKAWLYFDYSHELCDISLGEDGKYKIGMNGKLFKTVSEAEVEGTLNDLVNQKIEKIRKKDPVYATAMLENLNKI